MVPLMNSINALKRYSHADTGSLCLFGQSFALTAVLSAFAGQRRVVGKKKKDLPLHMDGDSSPALFKALDRLREVQGVEPVPFESSPDRL